LNRICDEGKIPESLMTMPVIAPGEQVIELMIPASKVGLIIGKCSGGILSVIKVGNTPIHRCTLIVFKEKNIKRISFKV